MLISNLFGLISLKIYVLKYIFDDTFSYNVQLYRRLQFFRSDILEHLIHDIRKVMDLK